MKMQQLLCLRTFVAAALLLLVAEAALFRPGEHLWPQFALSAGAVRLTNALAVRVYVCMQFLRLHVQLR